jgi:hypothetical protein
MGAGNPGAPADTNREEYLAYAEAMMMKGQQPLAYAEWIKAGKPKG